MQLGAWGNQHYRDGDYVEAMAIYSKAFSLTKEK